jgi:hypothetical protein
MDSACQCDTGNDDARSAVVARASQHPDWRVREYAAYQLNTGRPPDDPAERGVWDHAWDAVRDALLADDDPRVAAAVGAPAPTRAGSRTTAPAYDADTLAHQPLTLRQAVATAHPGGPAALITLIGDPVCSIRFDAAWNLLNHHRADASTAIPHLLGDPCPQVLALTVGHAGTSAGFQLGANPDRLVAYQAARTTTDPELLRQLAAHPSAETRSGVAANPSTPQDVLRMLALDEDPRVWSAAKNNPDRPSGLQLRRVTPEQVLSAKSPFIASGMVIGLDIDVPCHCGQLAIALHSWGFHCREHQLETDSSRQDGGSDGMLAWRAGSGRWHDARQYYSLHTIDQARRGLEPDTGPGYAFL